ncbi:MAG: NAD-dependent epimerase/dehydratase family protein [Bdellovibrionota bacterium]
MAEIEGKPGKSGAPAPSTPKTRKRLPAKGGRSRKHRVLVTGATSPLGRKLCEKLLFDKDVELVWGLSRSELPYYFKDLDPKRFVFKTCAPYNERRLAELCASEEFQAARIDTIVHLAFQVGRAATDAQIQEYNLRGTQNLLNIARETGSIRKFVFLSSAKIYDLPSGHVEALTEESPLNKDPDAPPYVKDLLEAEALCLEQMGKKKGLKVVVLRPSFVLGRNIHSFYSYYLDSPVCPRILGFNPVVNLVHSEDVVRALRLAITKDAEGVFNIPGKETKTLLEYIKWSGARTMPVPEALIEPLWQGVRLLQFNRHPFPFRSDWLKRNCVLSGARAKAELGYQPEHHVKFEEV